MAFPKPGQQGPSPRLASAHSPHPLPDPQEHLPTGPTSGGQSPPWSLRPRCPLPTHNPLPSSQGLSLQSVTLTGADSSPQTTLPPTTHSQPFGIPLPFWLSSGTPGSLVWMGSMFPLPFSLFMWFPAPGMPQPLFHPQRYCLLYGLISNSTSSKKPSLMPAPE